MMKKLWAAAAAAMLFVPAAVLAEGGYVFDETSTLTTDELTQLNSKAQQYSQEEECGIYVVLTDDMHGYSEDDFAKGIFMNYDLGFGSADSPSGVLLAVSVNDRFFDSTAYGAASEAIGTYELDELNDTVYSYLSTGDWYGAGDAFIEEARAILVNNGYTYQEITYSDPEISHEEVQYSPEERRQMFLSRLPFAGVISAFLSFLINIMRKSKLKSTGRKSTAVNYIKPSGTHLDQSLDLYCGTTRTRMRMPRNNGSGPSSGGHSYHSSGFSHSSGGHHF